MSAPSFVPAKPALREIADGVYVFEQPPGGWCLNNAGLITGSTRSVLIDTAATEQRARRLKAEVEQIVPNGPDMVVNTHFHRDHVFGNFLFARPGRRSSRTRAPARTSPRRVSVCARSGRPSSGAPSNWWCRT
jgi:glyoxylase-like metal-dependent hydrolase (beta-lactamase superfamily II)